MQIVIRLSDNLIQYSGEENTLLTGATGLFSFDPYLMCATFIDSNATPETHKIIGGVTLPVGYQDGDFTYENNTFTPTPEYAAQAAAAETAAWNAGIKAQLDALDIKRIRPTAEGDTAYLTTLNAQALALRGQLK